MCGLQVWVWAMIEFFILFAQVYNPLLMIEGSWQGKTREGKEGEFGMNLGGRCLLLSLKGFQQWELVWRPLIKEPLLVLEASVGEEQTVALISR